MLCSNLLAVPLSRSLQATNCNRGCFGRLLKVIWLHLTRRESSAGADTAWYPFWYIESRGFDASNCNIWGKCK